MGVVAGRPGMEIMLSDFSMRMVFGLALATLVGVRGFPNSLLRTIGLVLLGFSTLAVTASWAEAGRGWVTGAGLVAALGAYVGFAAWTLGRERAGRLATATVAAASAAGLAAFSAAGAAPMIDAVGRGSSGFLVGAALAAMLLGHGYLTEPTTAIGPLRRAIGVLGLALAVRAGLAGWGLGAGWTPTGWLFATVRWGLGLAGPAVATPLAWKAAGIRSTQSATGILFVALGFVLAGELASMAASREASAIV